MWERVKSHIKEGRQMWDSKSFLVVFEKAAQRFETWNETRNPGNIATMRKMMSEIWRNNVRSRRKLRKSNDTEIPPLTLRNAGRGWDLTFVAPLSEPGMQHKSSKIVCPSRPLSYLAKTQSIQPGFTVVS